MDYATRLRHLGCEPPEEPVECDIDALEAEVGVALPASYRRFLKICGGWWGDLSCPSQEPTPFGDHWLNGFHDVSEVRNLLDSLITPRSMITIGWGHFAKYTCLSIAGIDHGSVYALDGEFRCYWSDEEFRQRFNAMADEIRWYLEFRQTDGLPEKPAGYDSLYRLAGSFDEFLLLCQPCSDG